MSVRHCQTVLHFTKRHQRAKLHNSSNVECAIHLNGVMAQIAQCKERVKRAFHTDLFMMLDALIKANDRYRSI